MNTAEWLDDYSEPVIEAQQPSLRSKPLSLVEYEKEIRDIPIPDPIEIQQLAEIIQSGKNAEDILETLEFAEIEFEQEVKQIMARAEAGRIAQERLFIGHLRFAAHVARLTMGWVPFGQARIKDNGESVFRGARIKNLSQFAVASTPLEDRIQAANLGLMKAVQNYKPDRGATFTTFAMYYLEQAIGRAIKNDGTIRVPIHIHEERSRILKEGSLESANYPSISGERYTIYDRVSVHKVLGKMIQGLVSLDEVDERELIASDREPFEVAEMHMQEQVVQRVLEALPDREKIVLEMRYGLMDGEIHTLEEIGHVLDLTRERIRQLETQALRRLGGLRDLYHGISEYASPRRTLLASIEGDLDRICSLENAAQYRIDGLEAEYENLGCLLEGLTKYDAQYYVIKDRREETLARLGDARYRWELEKIARVLTEKALDYVRQNAFVVDRADLPATDTSVLANFIKENCDLAARSAVVSLLNERLSQRFDKVNRKIILMADKQEFWGWLKFEIDTILAEIDSKKVV